MTGRYVLCRDHASFAAAVSAARATGTVQDGFASAVPRRGDLLCAGRVCCADDEREALMAAAHGALLILLVDASRPSPGFLEDLGHLGPVEWRRQTHPSLGAEERSVLEHLSDGLSLAEAARRLHVSRRTADRRLRAAREALGAASTAEAVVRLRFESSAGRG